MRKRYPIEIVNGGKLEVTLPDKLLEGKTCKRIAFGSKAIDVEFIPAAKERIVISRKISELLYFPDIQIPLHVFFEDETMYIGPLIGIFTAGFSPFPLKPIGERTTFFAKLLSVQKSVGALPFVFGKQHINWEQGLISGYFYHKNEWKMMDVPFPNVIYDRLPNRRSERSPILSEVKERLQKDYLIPWYNPGFFNKLDIYERLLQESSVADYLPETHPFTSFSMIETMLSKYGHVYVKPMNGSLGIGVHQIIYDKHQDVYYCRYQERNGDKRLRKFSSIEGLCKSVFHGQPLGKMLVQQGIHLLRYDQKIVDFRVHTNKDDRGDWQVTAIAAKIAGHGSATTHIRSGGLVKTLNEIFPKEEVARYTEMLSSASLSLSKALEKNIGGILGEIGFDLGIDRNGSVWLFEANSKPGRSIFHHPELKEFDFLTRKLSIAFSIFLMEQTISHPEEIFK